MAPEKCCTILLQRLANLTEIDENIFPNPSQMTDQRAQGALFCSKWPFEVPLHAPRPLRGAFFRNSPLTPWSQRGSEVTLNHNNCPPKLINMCSLRMSQTRSEQVAILECPPGASGWFPFEREHSFHFCGPLEEGVENGP